MQAGKKCWKIPALLMSQLASPLILSVAPAVNPTSAPLKSTATHSWRSNRTNLCFRIMLDTMVKRTA